tara:strand:- start:197 stop:676 length:480 start_codon:yes stop_codon:yes gene_type:complete
MSFTFDMPAFDAFGRTGETTTLEITVDNGGTSSGSQSFLNTEIIAMEVLEYGLFANSMTYVGLGSAITTDAGGVATLAFLDGGAYYAFANFSGGYIQVGRDCDYTIVGQPILGTGSIGCGTTTIWPLYSAPPASAPTPATLLLFGLGLAGLSLSRRKKA